MATKTQQMIDELAGSVKPTDQATAEQGASTNTNEQQGADKEPAYKAYTPTFGTNYVVVTPEEKDAINKMYEINPDETFEAYFHRTNPKPKEIDEKKAKRARLFAGIGDGLMALADGITLAKGGLIGKRESNLGEVNKVIEAQREKAAKELAAYNALYQQALQSDSKVAREARQGKATAIQKLYNDARTANRAIDAANLKAANEADKFNTKTYNDAVKDAADKAFRANQNELNRKNATRNAGIRAAASKGNNDDSKLSGILLNDGTFFKFPPQSVRQVRGELSQLVEKAMAYETEPFTDESGEKINRKTKLAKTWEAWKEKGLPGEDEAVYIIQQSKYYNTPEGQEVLKSVFGAPKNINGGAVLPAQMPNLKPIAE